MIRTSTKTRAFTACLCALALAIQPLAMPLAHAEPSAADLTTAKSLVVEGRELRAKGKHAPARDRFKAAFALVSTPIIGMDLAHEHEALGELVEAREMAIAVTKLPPNSKESEEGKAARSDAAKLANGLAERIPSLTIKVQPPDAAASVSLDGTLVPPETLGVARKLNPGKHEIVVRRGEQTQKRTVTLAEGGQESVVFELKQDAGEDPTPGTGPKPSPGPSSTGDTSAGRPAWAWLSLGAAGVGAVVGTVGAFKALSGASDFNEANATCGRLDEKDPRCGAGGELTSQKDDGLARKSSGLVLVGIGGAVLVGGVILFLIAPSGAKTTTATGLTGVGLSTQGFSISGRF